MDLTKFTKGVDTWEGQNEIDEGTLLANGVEFILVRINDMNGGHHLDTGFIKQWCEAINFLRFPYFVYNPWVNSAANYTFLKSVLPNGVRAVAVDVEVSYAGTTPDKYADEVDSCINLMLANNLRPFIYTGSWFLNVLAHWPQNVSYWWARYPFTFYPSITTTTTWVDIDAKLKSYPYWNPGTQWTCKLWQFSADRFIPPGVIRPIDLNLFYGSPIDMISYYGMSDIQVPVRLKPTIPTPPTLEEKVNRLWDAHPELH